MLKPNDFAVSGHAGKPDNPEDTHGSTFGQPSPPPGATGGRGTGAADTTTPPTNTEPANTNPNKRTRTITNPRQERKQILLYSTKHTPPRHLKQDENHRKWELFRSTGIRYVRGRIGLIRCISQRPRVRSE